MSGRTAAATVSGVAQVTSVPSSPEASTWSVPPYSGRSATACRRPDRAAASRTAVSAAIPLANATDSDVPSSVARADSNRATVGFHSRAYTGPPSVGRPPWAIDS